MPGDLAVDLCEDVARVGWPSHTEQIAAIMDHVVPPAELRLFGQPVAARTQQQNYVCIEHHVPERIWNGHNEQFTTHLCEFICVDMGLQNASESTVQKMVALSLLITHGGRHGATSTSWNTKRSLTDLVKKYLKQHRYQRPVEWIETLPRDQLSFQAEFPRQWTQSQARGDNQAVPCPHSAVDVQAVFGGGSNAELYETTCGAEPWQRSPAWQQLPWQRSSAWQQSCRKSTRAST
jgi:hypothetical protein